MSDDIVGRLRERSENWEIDCKFDPSCDDAQMDRDAADEIEQLRRWKAEATEILARWDAVSDTIEIGPNQLGLHKSDLVAIELNDLRAQRDGYFASSHEWRDEYRNLHTLVLKWVDAWDDTRTDVQDERWYHEITVRRIDTGNALRKAVGR